jgi:hypothetical protein
VEGELDVEEAYAARMDERIVWEAGETRWITSSFLSFLCPSSLLIYPYPGICAGGEGFLMFGPARRGGRFPLSVFLSTGVRDCKREENKQTKKKKLPKRFKNPSTPKFANMDFKLHTGHPYFPTH